MALTIKEVEHVALLARLSLTDEQKMEFAEQLGGILEYANKLKQLDTEDVVPLNHILPIYNVFREDEVYTGTTREELLSNGPLTEQGQYKVPKIV
ncbi:MAG: Asp-tRNA(Asn)/Glu-tRNA(Gln) amidotransferase subunit GatC [Syntrophomonadaceae bacterium]|nr:Asp-tRNA(Asn)/Glu-tRNA(Gln) amidotransferase subunit GatC [Syntrophomonadaceae bacterium]